MTNQPDGSSFSLSQRERNGFWRLRVKKALLGVLLGWLTSGIACGGFSQTLRLTLAASAPLLDSLVASGAITPSLRAGLLVDFSELAQGAAGMAEDFKICDGGQGSRECKLVSVQRYEALFEVVEARGHFGSHERLQRIEILLRGIINSALIYYGGGGATGGPTQPSSRRAGAARGGIITSEQAQRDLKQGIEDLKAAMRP